MTEDAGDGDPDRDGSSPDSGRETESLEELRKAVETQYDFDDFTPEDMASMSQGEWAAVFDDDTWITGTELLDRLESDLRSRVAERDLFAVIERPSSERLLAYSDSSYVEVDDEGRVDGDGPIRREVEPIVALCAMEEYEPGDTPVDQPLPNPDDVEAGSGRLGHVLLQLVAGVQILGGLGLLAAPLFVSLPGRSTVILTTTAGLGFLVVGVILFVLVANARLSGRFQAQGYQQRLQAAGVGRDSRPDFVPIEDESPGDRSESADR